MLILGEILQQNKKNKQQQQAWTLVVLNPDEIGIL